MASSIELEAANTSLRLEIEARERVEKELQGSLEELRRTARELEQFAYITSHDLQAPLRNVAGFAQLLSRRYASKLDGDALEFLQFIEQGVREMQSLIRDLLSLSRVGRTEAKVENRPLEESVKAALATLKTEIETRGAHILPGDLQQPLLAVHPLLVQLFQNLIGNAIKFQEPGARPEVTITAEREDAGWHIRVRDNGIGIPADQLENVFAVFRRLHSSDQYEGTGIGLAICRKIVQHHRGEIWAESGGSGSTFHVRLPAGL